MGLSSDMASNIVGLSTGSPQGAAGPTIAPTIAGAPKTSQVRAHLRRQGFGKVPMYLQDALGRVSDEYEYRALISNWAECAELETTELELRRIRNVEVTRRRRPCCQTAFGRAFGRTSGRRACRQRRRKKNHLIEAAPFGRLDQM